MKQVISIFILISIFSLSCNKIKEKTKNAINKAGE